MDAVLGILGMDEEKPEIDYRERAPLVVPPKMVLRPPEASPIEGNKAWPQDPDVQRRKAADAQKKLPGGMTDEERSASTVTARRWAKCRPAAAAARK